MNFNRITRTFLCLLVVCILVFNVYAIPAKAVAVSAPPIPIPVDASNLLHAILKGLLGLVGDSMEDVDPIIRLLLDNLNWADVVDVLCAVVGGNSMIVVPRSIVEEVRSALFTTSVLTEVTNYAAVLPANSYFATESHGTLYTTSDCYAFGYEYYNVYQGLVLVPFEYNCTSSAAKGLVKNSSGSSLYPSSGQCDLGTIRYFYYEVPKSVVESFGLNYASGSTQAEAFANFYSGNTVYPTETSVTTSYGITLTDIEPTSVPFEDAYSGWAEGSVSIPDSEDDSKVIVYVPVGIGETQEETGSLSQEDVWVGEGTLAKNQSITGSVTGSISQTWLGEKLDALTSVLSDVWTSIKSLAESLLDTISTALTNAFAISDTFVSSKVAALTADYPYLDTFVGLGNNLKGFFLSLGTKPPVIYIDLGAIDGQNNYGGKQIFVDLTWYAEYKPTMDAILSGFIWLWFAWRLYLNIPSLIEGGAGFWGTPDNNIGKDIIYEPQRRLESPLRHGSPIGPERQLPSGRRGFVEVDRRKDK